MFIRMSCWNSMWIGVVDDSNKWCCGLVGDDGALLVVASPLLILLATKLFVLLEAIEK